MSLICKTFFISSKLLIFASIIVPFYECRHNRFKDGPFESGRECCDYPGSDPLAGSEVYVSLSSAEEVWEAIYKLKVRGAPAIGIAAAYGIYVCSRLIVANTYDSFYSEFLRMKDYLASSRPTAVNLVAALDGWKKLWLPIL